MPRRHLIVRKILENVPPHHFMPRPYYLDLLDAAEERNTIICKDEDVTMQFISQTLYKDLAIRTPNKCMLVLVSDRPSAEDAAKTFKYVTDVPVFVPSPTCAKVPNSACVIFMPADTAALLCVGSNPIFSIPERVFLLVVDDCEQVLSPGHPYQCLFPYSKDPLTCDQVDEIWDRKPSFYSRTSPGYRVVALTSNILAVGCSDPLFVKQYICSLEDRLGCRLETTSDLINLLSLGAQPEEDEIPAPPLTESDDSDCNQHPIRGTMLRLLEEAHSFLNDVDFSGSEENVATTGQRVINVPFYCLRAVAQCEAITKELGAYCGALIARVFLRHLYRLERSRAAILEARSQLEHGEDLLTRILRYTATQLSMIARLFQTVCDNCVTKQEIRCLASPRVLQLVDQLKKLKPTGSYRIEAVWKSEGVSEDTESDSDGVNSRINSRSILSGSRKWSSRRRKRFTPAGFVAPHGFETMDVHDDYDEEEEEDENRYGDDNDSPSSLSVDSLCSEDETDNDCSGALKYPDNDDDNDGESGGESDVTDVSMGLSSGIRRKLARRPTMRPHKLRTPTGTGGRRGGSRLIYRVLPDNPDGEATVPPLCGLLLVGGCQFSAYALPRFIEEYCNWDPDIAFVRPGYFFVPGASDQLRAVSLSGDVGSTQEETVANFRCGGEVNLLVTTQSGLAAASSLPRCNLIASFHPSTSLASYLAAKSRLRLVAVKSAKAHFWHFLEPDGISLRSRFQKVERMLVQRCSKAYLIVDEHDVDATYVDEQFDFLPKRKASRSIDTVNHYCARLPCNFMTRLAPRWHLTRRILNKNNSGIKEDIAPLLTCPNTLHDSSGATNVVAYRCSLRMPINSPVRDVVWGDWSLCKKMAKYSAAVRIGQLLLAAREIDSRGRPVLRHTQIPAFAAASRRSRAARDRSPPKHKSSYLVKTPDVFTKCLAKEDKTSVSQNRLYIIDIRHLDTPLSRLQREHRGQGTASHIDFFPEAENRGFGFLTTKPLPFIPEFSIFTRSGEETVQIYETSTCLPLNIDHLNRLSRFHRILFKSVLRFEKECLLKFNLVEAPCQLLIVPVKRDCQEIDWDLVDLCLTSYLPSVGDCRLPVRRRPAPPIQLPSEPVPLIHLLAQTVPLRTVFNFVEEDFVNTVLTPTYRNVEYPPRYYVVSIRKDMSPATEFPSTQYATFADYYACKYGLRLSGSPLDQPLLDATYAPLRLAPLLVPRSCALQRKSNSTPGAPHLSSGPKHPLPRHIQLLVPEFCHRHPIPATVWQKAICLPTIIYRLQHLLLAEELRSDIAREAGVGTVQVPHRVCFPPLRCYFTPQPASSSASPSPSPPPPMSTKDNEDPGEPEIVKLTLSPPKASMSRSPADTLQTLLHESDRLESNEKLELEADYADGEEGEGDEEEVDARSMDSFEEKATNLCFFPSEDDDENEDAKSLTLLAAGDFINMERLETIGDSFLKFAVTTDLFLRYPEAPEGHLSALRSQIVGNSNLYRLGCKKNLPGRIVGVAFEPHENWLPPCYVCAPSSANNTASTRVKTHCTSLTHQFLTNKSIADCVEALVGCYLTDRGERSALKVLHWFGIECLPPADEMQASGPPWKPPEGRPLTEKEEAAIEWVYRAGRFPKLEEIIGYTFRNRRLLIEAFTHSTCRDLHSAPSDNPNGDPSSGCSSGYERLEFLGDAVLDYAVTRFLFATDATARLSPGALTDLRSALVNNMVFGALAVRYGLHAFLRAAAPPLARTMALFLRHHHDVVRGDLDVLVGPETSASLVKRPTAALPSEGDRANEEVELPKALGDVFESLAGAVFLDSGLCLNTLWRVFFPLLRERIERYSACVAKSPVRRLLELCPERVKFERLLVRPDGKMRVGVRVAGIGRYVGVGRTYRLAKSAAADLAYRRVREVSAKYL